MSPQIKMSPHLKKILVSAAGGALFLLCAASMVQCSGNGKERDQAKEKLAAMTARADSLQTLQRSVTNQRDEAIRCAAARGDSIRSLTDSVRTQSDSIVVLNDSIDVLNCQLTDCRGGRRRSGVVRPKAKAPKTVRRDTVVVIKNNACQNNGQGAVQNNNNNIIVVPAQGTTNVTVNGGNGNTVNVNNGTINNYYTPSQGTVTISSSASVSTTRIVKVRRQKCH